jgi:hypothetical protein
MSPFVRRGDIIKTFKMLLNFSIIITVTNNPTKINKTRAMQSVAHPLA